MTTHPTARLDALLSAFSHEGALTGDADRFDVAIINVERETVSSIAAFSVRQFGFGEGRPSAEQVLAKLRAPDALRLGFVAISVPAGSLRRGDSLQIKALQPEQ